MPTRKRSTKAKTRPTVYKVFVSSTYLDNRDRRKLVEDAITMAGMLWHGMELFTASTRPTVEECLRYAREADLLVGIIAWRYGWEPEGETSITEMEYDAATERLMFLLDPLLPVNPDKDFDPGPERWKKQEKLEAFKQRIAHDQTPALFTETTLGTKVLQALHDWRADHEQAAEPDRPVPKQVSLAAVDDDLEAHIRLYSQTAASLHAGLPVAGFATQLKVAIDIEDIYVPLRAMVDLRGIAEETFADAAQAEKLLRESDATLEISLPEAFRQSEMRHKRGIVILGDPGSGKTTHLKRLLLWCLRQDPERIDLPSGMLPVFLPLRELQNLEQGLDAFIQEQLHSPHLKTPQGFGERLLRRGNLLLLLDGLDEVADLAQREQVAEWIVQGLRWHPTCRFVVTSRFAGYSPTVRLSEDFLEMHIRPLTAEQVARFVHNWYAIVETGLAKDPQQAVGIAREKATHFGDSWWQEVGLLLLALEDPSLFTPYMRQVVQQPAFATSAELVEVCLDDAAETAVDAFVELLRVPAGSDSELWARQLQALRVLDRLDSTAVGALAADLARHPSPEIRRWLAEQAAQAAQDVVISAPGDYELVKIPGGVLVMGSPESEEGRWDDEGPVHEVRVSDFYLGRYPVINEEYGRFLTENPDVQEPRYWADRRFNQPRQPVVGVSWEEARRYAEWAGLRLPSEAEWEYACRAGTRTRYYTGDTEGDLSRAGWYHENSDGNLHLVGEKAPNAFGLYDMHGNVWEWVEDDWHDNYQTAPDDARAWIDAPRGAARVVRGGGWYDFARICRAAARFHYAPGVRGNDLGFRLARSVALGP